MQKELMLLKLRYPELNRIGLKRLWLIGKFYSYKVIYIDYGKVEIMVRIKDKNISVGYSKRYFPYCDGFNLRTRRFKDLIKYVG